jgi:hypothetical protein
MKSRSSLLLGLAAVLLVTGSLAAQPFGSYLTIGSGSGYVAIPHSSAFDFTTGYTFEAWVSVSDPAGACKSIWGNTWTAGQWVGICGTTLRSYVRGFTSGSTTQTLFDAGKVPVNEWAHIAVTWDGTTRRHFIDGEEVGARAETGGISNTTSEIRIGSDVAYQFSPIGGAMDEVRFWNVARTKDQIRANITKTINAPQAGLVAVYHFDGNANDAIAGHHGTTTGTAAYLAPPVVLHCTANATTLCVSDTRFLVSVKWIDHDGNAGIGTVVTSNSDSGVFWFFGSNNWELLVKVLDACVVPFNRKWFFSAATTDVHYQAIVTDVRSGVTKRYFNWQSVSAPAVTDTDAFATCP